MWSGDPKSEVTAKLISAAPAGVASYANENAGFLAEEGDNGGFVVAVADRVHMIAAWQDECARIGQGLYQGLDLSLIHI